MNLYDKKSSTANNGTFITVNRDYRYVRIPISVPLSDSQDSSFGNYG